jgi:hypothetical protein
MLDGDIYELSGLKGNKNRPVFSTVFGDNRYNARFINECVEKYNENPLYVNNERAVRSGHSPCFLS